MVDSIKEKIKKLGSEGFFHILFGGTLTKIIAFFASILIVRFVSKEEYAFLSYADNIYSYVYLIAGLGFDSAILKYCVSDNLNVNKAYFSFALKNGSFSSAIIVSVVLIGSFILPIPFPESRKYIISIAVYPFLYFYICILQAFMRARLKNKEYAYAGIIQTGVVFIVSIGLVHYIGAFSVVVARYIAILIIVIFCIVTVRPELTIKGSVLKDEEKRSFIKFGLSVLVANVFSMVMPINEVFLVNNLIQDAVITANYKVANLIPQQLSFVTSAIITFYFPYFARMKQSKEIWIKSKNVGALTAVIISIIAGIGILVSPFIITLAYGDKYSDINWLMSTLWIMHAINAAFRMLPMNILPAIGYTKFNMIMSICSCFCHFVIDFVCIKSFGIKGAVLAGGIIYLFTSFFYWIYLYKKTRGSEMI